jgi:UDP-N-acetylglucosamine diphosphorylase/glucosamine-1-phosphate N-acetyltransferase
MKKFILADEHLWLKFLPFTYTRPVGEFRIGILTLKEKWEKYLDEKVSYKTIEYLQEKYPISSDDESIFINSAIIPNREIAESVKKLAKNQSLIKGDVFIGGRSVNKEITIEDFLEQDVQIYDGEVQHLTGIWDIFYFNSGEIVKDFELLTSGRKSEPEGNGNFLINKERIFIEEGAKINFACLNASNGPIYIGKNAEVMEGSVIRGPFALCESSAVKMGAKIYEGTTIGPHCKVGGEVNNAVFFGYSNKGHDGFIGNSVIGEWCNIGADSNNSNLKNNYDEVKVWSYEKNGFIKTGLQFCGLFMGDHSKCGINTMFNTGTVVGVSANVFGSGFPRNFVPSFSWGGASGFSVYQINKALETAARVMERRNISLTESDKKIMHKIFELSEEHRRNW